MVSRNFSMLIVGVAFILVLSWIGISILRGATIADAPLTGNCRAQIASVKVCLIESGEWNSDLKNLKADDYGVSKTCLKPNGPLEGTPYKADETHFNCGPKPA
ncbi:hypothetical protein HY989_02815 [Candidatus Micrarchaeota archaeon]|nr:hypothetical protein [Candidatus Micrarchaeota archaeon]